MSNIYIASAHTAAGALTEVTTTAALKTVLQVATPSTTQIIVLGWGCSFDGVTSTAVPGELYLLDGDVTATVTSLTPDTWGNPNAPASLCVGGASATGVNASAEGTITTSRLFDAQHVHPQTGYSVWFPADARPRVAVSRFLRIRCNFAVGVNALPWVVWDE